jgi:hypothetical protein
MMTILEAIDARHSVRAYQDKPIDEEIRKQLDAFLAECNQESGLNIFIRYDDPDGFDSRLARYGSFRNVKNYIILAGRKTADFNYICGYYGEKVVLYAQQLGLNTCWAALTFNRKKVRELIQEDETLCMVIALGYGETQGHPHKGKSLRDVVEVKGGMPEWFVEGVESALKAPTAVNQQKFTFSLDDGKPSVRARGLGSNVKVDLGIVAYHFDAATGMNVSH